MNIPKDYPISKDIYDRRNGQKPSLGEKVRDVAIATRNDWNDMKANERRRAGKPDPNVSPLAPTDTKKIGNKVYPSFKRGGIVKKTGLAYVHKGERVTPVRKQPAKRKRG